MLLTVATVVSDELHITDAVRLAVRGPVNVPVAINCCVSPSEIELFVGVTLMETSPAALPVPVRLIELGLPKAP